MNKEKDFSFQALLTLTGAANTDQVNVGLSCLPNPSDTYVNRSFLLGLNPNPNPSYQDQILFIPNPSNECKLILPKLVLLNPNPSDTYEYFSTHEQLPNHIFPLKNIPQDYYCTQSTVSNVTSPLLLPACQRLCCNWVGEGRFFCHLLQLTIKKGSDHNCVHFK